MASRVDGNQREIVAALRAMGASVQCLHEMGRGCPDLIVGFRGVNYLLECKSPGGKLTPDQWRWHSEWRGQVAVVRTVEDAAVCIGAIGTLTKECQHWYLEARREHQIVENADAACATLRADVARLTAENERITAMLCELRDQLRGAVVVGDDEAREA